MMLSTRQKVPYVISINIICNYLFHCFKEAIKQMQFYFLLAPVKSHAIFDSNFATDCLHSENNFSQTHYFRWHGTSMELEGSEFARLFNSTAIAHMFDIP
jgi:hypothetical protein